MEQHIIQCHIVSSILKANTPPQHTHTTHIRTIRWASRRRSAQRIYTFKACIYACNNLHLRYSDNHLQNVSNNNERGANERGRERSHKYGSSSQFLFIHPFSLSLSLSHFLSNVMMWLSSFVIVSDGSEKAQLKFPFSRFETNASNIQQCVLDTHVCVYMY